jgi:hypothetical protein
VNGEQAGEELRRAERAARTALRSAGRLLPHLSGLAHVVRASASTHTQTAAVFASGRIVVNPRWFLGLSTAERVFVVAHEMLHLALKTHERCRVHDALLFNVAHDYIINDMLREELGCSIPTLGLDMPGASQRSAEEIVAELMAQGGGRRSAWGGTLGTLGEALVRAGVSPPVNGGEPFDALDDATERAWFPVELEGDARVDAAAARALALGTWQRQLKNMLEAAGRGVGREAETATAAIFNAQGLRALPPWELALQRWLEDVAPAARTFARPSRRQGARCDVVLAGRRRDAWTLNLLLDTSGSMWSELGKVLGVIAGFCTAVDIIQVRILQCSNGLERDEIVAVEDLAAYRVQGGGVSDLRPGFDALAADPGVDAAVVVTDGEITYPQQAMPFAVLWTLIGPGDGFTPSYGHLVRVQL